MGVPYFKLNEALEAVAVVENHAELPSGGRDPSIWARQPIGGVWDKRYSNGFIGAGWISRCDFPSFEFVEKLAASLNKLQAGANWIPVDNGPSVSPRYDVMQPPKVGDDCSKSFNGDYYPVGKVVKVGGQNSKIISVEGPQGLLRFYRRGLSSGWIQAGGTWGLVKGVHDRMNPEY
jgi:hypothetical protein